jgi:UDP-glucuronate 4-epimerase
MVPRTWTAPDHPHFMTILVTGAAGFIGYHVARRLAERGGQVVGVDNLTDFYGTELKRRRLVQLSTYPNFKFYRLDLSEKNALLDTLRNEPVDIVIHLAAQANVRYAIENPHAYVDSNVAGHLNVLEYCRNARGITNLVYASSSSVYGARNPIPFREGGETDRPTSLYAATKKSQEMMSQVYADIFGVPQIGLRFFSVYGPWGRPDMAYWLFTERSCGTSRSASSTTATCTATSPTSTMSSPACWRWRTPRRARPARCTASTTSDRAGR